MALEPITRQEKIIAGQDLTPITRMEKFLKQFGGGGGGLPTGGAPYQQLVTDGEGNAKWEDRLAYESEPVEIELMPEQTVAFSDSGEGVYAAISPVNIDIQNGVTYKIAFDGNVYDCIGRADPVPHIGNYAILGMEDTGEPFLYAALNDASQWLAFDSSNQHTIAVSARVPKIETILPKYIPCLNVVISGNDTNGYTSNYTADEIRSAYQDGVRVQGVYFNGDALRLIHLRQPSKATGALAYYPIVFYEFAPAEDFHWSIRGSYYYKEYRIDDRGVTVEKQNSCLVLKSSTSGSSKQFKITVDDSGTVSATEVT